MEKCPTITFREIIIKMLILLQIKHNFNTIPIEISIGFFMKLDMLIINS